MRLFLVLGPESSGSRLATEIVSSGAGDNDQVIHRSVPHNKEWISETGWLSETLFAHVVITVRDWWCMASSQVQIGHVGSLEQAFGNIHRAYHEIFSFVREHGLPYTMLVYESLILNPKEVQTALLQSLGLTLPDKEVEMRNENRKHWSAP